MSPTIALPMGQGIDRYTGAAQVQPGSFVDLRNLRPLRGKAQIRGGSALRGSLPDQGGNPCTAVPLLHPMQSHQEAVAVGYYAASREVHIYRITGNGTSPSHVGLWFTLHATAQTPPRFTGAESYGQVAIAHDEPLVSRRAPTQVFNAFTGELDDLTANLDGSGVEPIYFRGVVDWKNYLLGWGFGSASSARPEIVRVSLPGQPTVFDPEHYFIAGNRGASVTTVRAAANGLVAFKHAASFEIVGTSSLNFGILPLYALIGCPGANLAVTIEGRCYFWTLEGPRVTTIGSQGDLAPPLDPEGPDPATLPAMGDLEDGFALYVPGERTIEWHFGSRVYALSLDEAEGAKWGFRVRPFAADCGALLYSGGASLGDDAPTGHPEITSAVGTGEEVALGWDNVGSDGDETVETWVRPDGGSWSQLPDVAVAATVAQDETFGGLEPSTDYDVAMRYRRAGLYHEDYQGEPHEWPVVSRSTFTTQPLAPTISASSWGRVDGTTEEITIEVTPLYDGIDLELLRGGVVVATAVAPHGGPVNMVDDSMGGEANHVYTARHTPAGQESDPETRWAGPDAPSGLNYTLTSVCGYTANWTNGDAAAETEVEDDWPDTVHTLRETAAAAATSQAVSHGDALETCDGAGVLIAVSVRIRHKLTSFTIEDFSEYEQRDDLTLCDNCASA